MVHLDGLISQGCFPKAAASLEALVRRVMASTSTLTEPVGSSALSLGHVVQEVSSDWMTDDYLVLVRWMSHFPLSDAGDGDRGR